MTGQRRLADDRLPRPPTAGRSSAAPTSRTTTARACPASSASWRRSTTRGATGATSRSSRPSSSRQRIEASTARRRPRCRLRRCPTRCSTRRSPASARPVRPRFGGFGRAPKFPQAMTLDFLLPRGAAHRRPRSLEMVTVIARRDGRGRHLRPGRRRLPPLLDRRPLARAALREDALRPGAARRARTCTRGWSPATRATARSSRRRSTYVLRDLRHADGGFFSAEDADSEGVEGKFYLWSLDEIEDVCGDDAARGRPVLRRHRRRQLRGSAHRLPRQHPPRRRPHRGPPDAVERGAARLLAAARAAGAARARRQGAARVERAVPALARPRRRRRSSATTGWTPRAPTRGSSSASCGATTVGCCGRGRAGAPTCSRTPRTTPRCSRRSSRWPRSTTSPGSRTRAPSPTSWSGCSPTRRAAGSSRPASTPKR